MEENKLIYNQASPCPALFYLQMWRPFLWDTERSPWDNVWPLKLEEERRETEIIIAPSKSHLSVFVTGSVALTTIADGRPSASLGFVSEMCDCYYLPLHDLSKAVIFNKHSHNYLHHSHMSYPNWSFITNIYCIWPNICRHSFLMKKCGYYSNFSDNDTAHNI